MSEQHTPTVARFYTAARRIPVLIGKINGARIPGGPYTMTQLIVGGVVLWIGYKTSAVWGAGLYPLVRMAVLLGVAYGATWVSGRIPATRRRLPDLLSDLGTALTLPELGTYRGRPIRVSRPHYVAGTVLMLVEPSQDAIESVEGIPMVFTTSQVSTAAYTSRAAVRQVR